MKRKFYATSAVIALAMSVLATGCSSSKQRVATEEATDSASMAADTLTVDSIGRSHVAEDSLVQSSVMVQFPQGSDSLAIAVRGYINNQLADFYMPYCNGELSQRKRTVYTGDLADGQAMVDFYEKGNYKYVYDEWKSLNEISHEEGIGTASDVKIKKTAENDKYLTYTATQYCYLGGAHGSWTAFTTNIAKKTHKVLTATVDAKRLADLQPLLRKGVVEYLKECGVEDVNTDNVLKFLQLEGNTIPMPAETPYLATDGVHFCYQQYEIADYATGMVGFVVSYDDIKPYLTEEAKQLVE